MALPHIKNSKAGINRQEPIFDNLFEVYFSIPEALANKGYGGEDVTVLTEQVIDVSGLNTLTKSPEKKTQTFMGTTRTYLGAKLDDTSHTIGINLQLNMRNGTDNYIFKLFREWNALAYDIRTGTRTLKNDHVADFLRVVEFNRNGDIFRDITYHDIQLTKVEMSSDSLNYEGGDIMKLAIEFVSDWADDVDA